MASQACYAPPPVFPAFAQEDPLRKAIMDYFTASRRTSDVKSMLPTRSCCARMSRPAPRLGNISRRANHKG